jgi:hypothetical protein
LAFSSIKNNPAVFVCKQREFLNQLLSVAATAAPEWFFSTVPHIPACASRMAFMRGSPLCCHYRDSSGKQEVFSTVVEKEGSPA